VNSEYRTATTSPGDLRTIAGGSAAIDEAASSVGISIAMDNLLNPFRRVILLNGTSGENAPDGFIARATVRMDMAILSFMF